MRRSVEIASVLLVLSAVTLDVGPLSAATTVIELNPPSDENTSFCQTWVSDDPNGIVFSNPAKNSNPNGNQVVCHSWGGSQTPQGNNWADTTSGGVSVEAGSQKVTVPDPVAIKCTLPNVNDCTRQARFIAVASYAQYGLNAPQKAGHLKGAGVVQMTLDGLKLSGNEGPTESRIILMLSDLRPKQVNGALLELLFPQRGSESERGTRLEKVLQLPDGWTVGYPSNVYVKVDLELRANGKLKINHARALNLCPYDIDWDDAENKCRRQDDLLTAAQFRDPCQVQGNRPRPSYCDYFGPPFFHRTSPALIFPLWIKIPEYQKSAPLSLSVVHCSKERRDADLPDSNICWQGP